MIQMIARFSGINDSDYPDILIDYKSLIDVSGKITDRSDISTFSFGVVSNGSDINFRDIYDSGNSRWVFDYLAEKKALIEGITIHLYILNTLTKNSEMVGEFKTDEWDYDSETRQVSVSFKDELEEWQDIEVEAEYPDPTNYNNSKNLEYFYNKLYNITKAKGYNISKFDDLDPATKTRIKNLWVNVAILKSGNLWGQWNKFCAFAQCHLLKVKDDIKLFYTGGN